MNTLTILIKPASSSCNLACKYCFYHDVADHRLVKSYGIMKENVRTSIIEKAFASGAKRVSFAFQGGEPTLAGLAFYMEFIEEVGLYNSKGATVEYSIQTNGYVIDEDWVKFFKEHHFLVGVSVDGPSHIHDYLRMTQQTQGTHKRIMESINLLRSYDVPFNILCVLSSYVAAHLLEVYDFFKKEEFKFVQYIPCLQQFGGTHQEDPFALTIEEYENTLDTLFTYYKESFDQGNYSSDRLFDNYVRMAQGYSPENCTLAGACTTYFVIEANGDVYPCDFYALDEFKIGNILDHGYVEMFTNSTACHFRRESAPLSEKCQSCKHLHLCRGGCKRYKVHDKETNENHLYYCDSYYHFFEKHTDSIYEIGQKVLQGYLSH
jgi:uncharacterized protein